MSLNINDYDYLLPPHLIAQAPPKQRHDSKLLSVNKLTGGITHGKFPDIINFFDRGDCLVLNETKVIPARLRGFKSTGAKVEVLLLKRISENSWEALVKPGAKIHIGTELIFGDGLKCFVTGMADGGGRTLKFMYDGIFEEILDSLGETPLPPYITQKLQDKKRYQTIYAKTPGSAAAPTAGLHFTDELLSRIAEKGVLTAKVTLHVGLGTFRPIKAASVSEHKMHSEYFELPPESAQIINDTKKRGGKVICTGTTSVRTVESCAENGYVVPQSGNTDIFIYPGYNFQITDCLITNFHLPKSTLIMLVSAMAGRENILNAYRQAISADYRFFSFGDAMYIY